MRIKIAIAILLFEISPSGLFAKRIDIPKEAPAVKIAGVLRQAKLVGVFCGDDVDAQTCNFFANALRTALKNQLVNVGLFYQPEVMVQSFYVPPMPLPFTNVTLRLIESTAGRDGITRVYLGGFCFDSESQDELGLQLPRWVESEGARDTGPIDTDRATAASKLAKEFAIYWTDTKKEKPQ